MRCSICHREMYAGNVCPKCSTSKTPRTDAVRYVTQGVPVVAPEHMMELERELAEVKADRDRLAAESIPIEWLEGQSKKHQIPLSEVETERHRHLNEMAWAFRLVVEMWRDEQADAPVEGEKKEDG